MCSRRLVAAMVVVALTAVDSSAFKPDVHAGVSEEALRKITTDQLPEKVQAEMRKLRRPGTTAVPEGFTDKAIREIADANKAMDTGECGKLGDEGASTPCIVETEALAALVQLLTKGATEAAHFDAEKIQQGSNLVFNAKSTIRRYLLEGNFAGARRVLGNALHSLQDFYAHTNWVELGRGGIDTRVGARMDAFSGTSPRLAAGNEPMCVDVSIDESWLDSLGSGVSLAGRWIGTHIDGTTPLSDSPVPDRTRLLTQMTKVEQDRLVKASADAEAKAKSEGKTFDSPITAATILKAIADRPLTSGYFYLAYPEVTYSLEGLPSLDDFINLLDLPGRREPPVIEQFGKCRHGWSLPVFSRFGATFNYRQNGINKDEPGRAGHDTARGSALTHTGMLVMDVIKDTMISGRTDYPDLILGLMGYEPAGPLINSFTILRVPAAPPTQTTWDGILEVFLNIWAVHPDIQTCVTAGGRTSCAPECSDSDTGNESRRCSQALPFRLPRTGSIRVEVWDNDPTGRQRMAVGEIAVDDPCLELTAHPPCQIPGANVPEDTLFISFESPERSTIPSTLPEGAPPLPPPPGAAPPPPSPIAPLAPPPAAPAVPASGVPAAPAPAPAGPTSLVARTAPTTAAALRTPAGIDAALQLRDADNCVGGDAYFPGGDAVAGSAVARRLGPDQLSRLYQATALFMTVIDPVAKANVLTAIQSRADAGDVIDLMNAFSPVQGQAIVSGYQGTAKAFVGRVLATGLDKLLAPARSAAALETDVNRWVARRLATSPLASEAVDRILGGTTPVSAECTVNELAKGGFTDVVNGL